MHINRSASHVRVSAAAVAAAKPASPATSEKKSPREQTIATLLEATKHRASKVKLGKVVGVYYGVTCNFSLTYEKGDKLYEALNKPNTNLTCAFKEDGDFVIQETATRCACPNERLITVHREGHPVFDYLKELIQPVQDQPLAGAGAATAARATVPVTPVKPPSTNDLDTIVGRHGDFGISIAKGLGYFKGYYVVKNTWEAPGADRVDPEVMYVKQGSDGSFQWYERAAPDSTELNAAKDEKYGGKIRALLKQQQPKDTPAISATPTPVSEVKGSVAEHVYTQKERLEQVNRLMDNLWLQRSIHDSLSLEKVGSDSTGNPYFKITFKDKDWNPENNSALFKINEKGEIKWYEKITSSRVRQLNENEEPQGERDYLLWFLTDKNVNPPCNFKVSDVEEYKYTEVETRNLTISTGEGNPDLIKRVAIIDGKLVGIDYGKKIMLRVRRNGEVGLVQKRVIKANKVDHVLDFLMNEHRLKTKEVRLVDISEDNIPEPEDTTASSMLQTVASPIMLGEGIEKGDRFALVRPDGTLETKVGKIKIYSRNEVISSLEKGRDAYTKEPVISAIRVNVVKPAGV